MRRAVCCTGGLLGQLVCQQGAGRGWRQGGGEGRRMLEAAGESGRRQKASAVNAASTTNLIPPPIIIQHHHLHTGIYKCQKGPHLPRQDLALLFAEREDDAGLKVALRNHSDDFEDVAFLLLSSQPRGVLHAALLALQSEKGGGGRGGDMGRNDKGRGGASAGGFPVWRRSPVGPVLACKAQLCTAPHSTSASTRRQTQRQTQRQAQRQHQTARCSPLPPAPCRRRRPCRQTPPPPAAAQPPFENYRPCRQKGGC